MVGRLFHVNSGAIRELPLEGLAQDRIERGTHLAILWADVLPSYVHGRYQLQALYRVLGLCRSIQVSGSISHVHGYAFQVRIRRMNKGWSAHLEYVRKLDLYQLISDFSQYLLGRLGYDSALIDQLQPSFMMREGMTPR